MIRATKIVNAATYLEDDTKSVLLLSWNKDLTSNFFQVFQVLEDDAKLGQSA